MEVSASQKNASAYQQKVEIPIEKSFTNLAADLKVDRTFYANGVEQMLQNFFLFNLKIGPKSCSVCPWQLIQPKIMFTGKARAYPSVTI